MYGNISHHITYVLKRFEKAMKSHNFETMSEPENTVGSK